jgi:hypothetical protein
VPEELDLDGLDQDCLHMLARNEQGQPIGTARMQENGKIVRMAILKPWARPRRGPRATPGVACRSSTKRTVTGVSSGTNPGDRLLPTTWLPNDRRRLPGRRHSPPEFDSEVAYSTLDITSLNVFDLKAKYYTYLLIPIYNASAILEILAQKSHTTTVYVHLPGSLFCHAARFARFVQELARACSGTDFDGYPVRPRS